MLDKNDIDNLKTGDIDIYDQVGGLHFVKGLPLLNLADPSGYTSVMYIIKILINNIHTLLCI